MWNCSDRNKRDIRELRGEFPDEKRGVSQMVNAHYAGAMFRFGMTPRYPFRSKRASMHFWI